MEQGNSKLMRWVAIALCALVLNAAKRPEVSAEPGEAAPASASDRQTGERSAKVAVDQTGLR
mgnify:CR=1 FL=1